MRSRRDFFPVIFCLLLTLQIFPLFAQTSNHDIPDLITSTIDDRVLVTLTGNRHPLARPEYDAGPAPAGRRMERMILTLGIDAARQKALDALVAGQHDPHSAQYHRWLTPESFGQQFGVSDHDLAQIVSWLRSHGLEVEQIARGRRSLLFSGTVAEVEAAFHTEMHSYNIRGEIHYANASDPRIPQALAGVVEGVVALHDFRSKPALATVKPVPAPLANASNGGHYLAPADFATIYDVGPLYQNSVNGTGQSIAVVARCNIHTSDVQMFRSFFGLSTNNPNIIVNGTDPGIVSTDEETEADLDTEWSGAVAQNAAIQLVVSASTTSTDGALLSEEYIVDNNLAPVMTLSFGLCEAAMGSAGNSFQNSLWQQAAVQGITVLAAAGDSGAAGCDADTETTATQGQAVSGLCSTPYDVCVGGTEFNDSSNPSAYWSASNGSNLGSALSYIPETVWNESGDVAGGSDLWAGGGGVSTVYAKPSWQSGPGVPADGMRDVPDVSLTAAGHDGYLIYVNGQLYSVAGTSAATPSFAGLMALAVEKTGGRLGNPDATLYSMASSQASGGATAFHDTTLGNNSVPGVTGFNASVGYDQASGLGSVDAAQLINNWGGASTPSLQVSLSSPAVSVADGASGGVTVTVGVSGGFSATVALSATGLPAGVQASFSPATLTSPGSGTSALSLSVGSQVAAGSYPLEITATGGSVTENASLTLTVTQPGSFTLSLTSGSVSVKPGGTTSVQATVSVGSGFSASVALSVSGLPAGVTATATPASFAAPGSGASTLLISAGAQTAAGSYPVTVTATGGGVTQNAPFTLTVTPAASFTLALSAPTVTVAQGGSGSVQESVTVSSGFNTSVTLTVSGQPAGVTVTPGYAVLAAPGAGVNTLSLGVGLQVAPGSYPLQITAAGGGVTQNATLTLIVTQPGSFTLRLSGASVNVNQGGSGSVGASVSVSGTFSAPVALAVAGLPGGVTAVAAPASFAAPGSGTSTLTLNANSQAAPGTYTLQVSATGAGVTEMLPLSLTVTAHASFTLSSTTSSMTVSQGASASTGLSVIVGGGFSSKIALSASGQPSGMTVGLSPASFAAPGSGTSTLKVSASAQTTPGTYSVRITATGGGLTGTLPVSVTVVPPASFTLAASAGSISLGQGGTAPDTLTVSGTNGFNAAVALSVSGLPSGVTASFSPSSFAAPGSGSSTLTLRATSTAAVGSHAITVTAAGGGVTKSLTLTLAVTAPPNFALSESPTSATVVPGSSTSFGFTLTETAGFSAPVTLTVSGMPSGVAVSFSPVTSPAAGVYDLTIELAAASNAPAASATLTLTATGGGITHATTFGLTVK